MKRLLPVIALLAAGAFSAAPALAQQTPPRIDAPKPPVLEKLEEDDPETKIPPKPGTVITQTRQQGRVTEAQVQTPSGSNYTVRANNQPGSIQPGELQSTSSRPATWNILQFELGKKSDKKDPPAAPPPPSSK